MASNRIIRDWFDEDVEISNSELSDILLHLMGDTDFDGLERMGVEIWSCDDYPNEEDKDRCYDEVLDKYHKEFGSMGVEDKLYALENAYERDEIIDWIKKELKED